jgi:glycogen debranching enzyme
VQGYVVGALRAMATVFRALGEEARAVALAAQAAALCRTIEERFWVRQDGYYALALDGRERQVPTITSNPGHLLFCGALAPERASRVVDVLLGDELYTGWGVRTLARGQAVFNPLSYHNGSVWPHDNALIALGAARVCGLGRAEGDFLVHYPVSCSPQAWASGAFFLLLQACLGLRPDASRRALVISNSHLPPFLDQVDLAGLRVGRSRVSLRFTRHGTRTHCDLLDVSGDEPLRVQIEIG